MIDRGRLAALRVAEDRQFERRTMRPRSLQAKRPPIPPPDGGLISASSAG
jgi:hypothetical protein